MIAAKGSETKARLLCYKNQMSYQHGSVLNYMSSTQLVLIQNYTITREAFKTQFNLYILIFIIKIVIYTITCTHCKLWYWPRPCQLN